MIGDNSVSNATNYRMGDLSSSLRRSEVLILNTGTGAFYEMKCASRVYTGWSAKVTPHLSCSQGKSEWRFTSIQVVVPHSAMSRPRHCLAFILTYYIPNVLMVNLSMWLIKYHSVKRHGGHRNKTLPILNHSTR